MKMTMVNSGLKGLNTLLAPNNSDLIIVIVVIVVVGGQGVKLTTVIWSNGLGRFQILRVEYLIIIIIIL